MKYSSEIENPNVLDPKKLVYNPDKYGYQYSNKLTKEGFEKGQRFLSRLPRYREIHPEIMDAIKAQRLIMLFSLLGVFLLVNRLTHDRNKQDRSQNFALFNDKEFVDRYSYKQKEVEYHPRINPGYPR